MTTRTEQETRRGAPVRGAVPTTGAKTGQRRPEPPHPAKPVPQPRPDAARRRPRADDEPWSEVYESAERCPDELLLF
ncbi:hypothetical protein, partial [Nonomuraea ferruginea]|uniref:hypothetical protein n=1 Tax=Nonomuraea ferruginea TaxID=46174 RepID=UPI0031EFAD12